MSAAVTWPVWQLKRDAAVESHCQLWPVSQQLVTGGQSSKHPPSGLFMWRCEYMDFFPKDLFII